MNRAKNLRKLYDQGCEYLSHWAESSSPADLDHACERFQELDGLVPEDCDLRILVDIQIGFCLAGRHALTGSSADRDEAISRLRLATSSRQPAEILDNCRLVLGGLVAQRALTKPAIELGELQEAETLLAAAAQSPALSGTQRATASAVHGQTRAMLAISRSWADLAGSKIPDIDALEAERRRQPADEPVRGPLTAVLGLALGVRSYSSGQREDRRRAVEFLADGLAASDRTCSWRDFALTFLAVLLAQCVLTDPKDVPAERIIKLAEHDDEAADAKEQGLQHALAFYGYHARAAQENRADDDETALKHLNSARKLLPDDHDVSRALLGSASGFLGQRGAVSGALEDRDAALAFIGAAHQIPGLATWLADGDPGSPFGGYSPMAHPSNYQGLTALLRAFDALGKEKEDPAHAIGEAEASLAALPPDSPARPALTFALGQYRQRRAHLMAQNEHADDRNSDAHAELIAGLRLTATAGEQATPGNLLYAPVVVGAASAQARLGLLTVDGQLIDGAIRRLRELTECDLGAAQAARARVTLGQVTGERFMLTGDRRDLNNGIVQLEKVCGEADQMPASLRVEAFWVLAEFYRMRDDANRGDRQRAIEAGLLALEERAAEVLLQAGARRGLEAAADTSRQGTRLASWCLDDDRLAEAVQTLEMGRALVLHAAALVPDIPALLRSADRADLADRWDERLKTQHDLPWNSPAGSQYSGIPPALIGTAVGADLFDALGQDGFEIPEDTRRQVLDVLRGCRPDADWLAPPAITDLSAGLRRAATDAFAYLIPAGLTGHRRRPEPGAVVLVGADGVIEVLRLPAFTDAQVAAYDLALQASVRMPDDPALRHRWHSALDELCGWAWDAVMGPLLQHLAGWRLGHPPRLVLIPTGRLGAVPWHAARTLRADGRPHYAIEDAVISYAASARQLATASRRTARPWAECPVLVSNPTGDLPIAGIECRELRRRFYPHAVLLGRPRDVTNGPGKPREVLARLPGGDAEASLLHCGCHATVTGSLASSYLTLADGDELTIAEIMAQAEGRDSRAPGFLAVLSACVSDLADVDHDEALTLASALLASGAAGVVGSRWPTRDLETAELMVMFHHFLVAGGAGRPADALRSAQLWMLDPGRQGLAGLPPLLADETSNPMLAEVHAWAGFTYQGA